MPGSVSWKDAEEGEFDTVSVFTTGTADQLIEPPLSGRRVLDMQTWQEMELEAREFEVRSRVENFRAQASIRQSSSPSPSPRLVKSGSPLFTKTKTEESEHLLSNRRRVGRIQHG